MTQSETTKHGATPTMPRKQSHHIQTNKTTNDHLLDE